MLRPPPGSTLFPYTSSSDLMVRIIEGIAEGDKILTSPPLDDSGKPETAKLDNETESE